MQGIGGGKDIAVRDDGALDQRIPCASDSIASTWHTLICAHIVVLMIISMVMRLQVSLSSPWHFRLCYPARLHGYVPLERHRGNHFFHSQTFR
jgi:hypothetical protein